MFMTVCPVLSGHCEPSVKHSQRWLQHFGRKVTVLLGEIRPDVSLLPVWSVLIAKSLFANPSSTKIPQIVVKKVEKKDVSVV